MDKLKKHIYDENNGLHYTLVGGCYILDLKLPEENRPIGRYGRLHRKYLKEEHLARYSSLILTGKLWTLVLCQVLVQIKPGNIAHDISCN